MIESVAVPSPRPGEDVLLDSALAQHLDPAALLRDAPDAMLLVDADGTVLYANQQAVAVFGHALADLVGTSVDVLLPESLRSAHRGHRESYVATPSTRPMGAGLELLAARADGTVFPVEISLSPMKVDGRRLTLAAVRDVSSQRAAEQALRRSEERFRLTFESSPVGIAILRLDGSWSYVNPAMCALTGRSEQELLATALSDLLPDGPLPLDVHTAGPGRVERRLERADGSTAWLEITLSVVRDGAGAAHHLVGHFYDVTERRDHQHELQTMALSDPLTGLPNRALLLDRCSQALAQLDRHPGRCALLILDLDHFKTVNDSLGHLAGDELLRQVASRLTSVARTTDTVARLGGDEFALLCNDLPAGEEHFSRRLLDALDADFRLPLSDGSTHTTRIGASIGIAVCSTPGSTATDLYRDADVALYEAKARGRGRAEVFDVRLRRELDRRISQEGLLRQALVRDGVRIVRQPLVRLTDREVLAHEALARLDITGNGELVPPAQFLPVAEERGLVPALDEAVLVLALDELRSDPTPLHVNVSATTLELGRWQEVLFAALDEDPGLSSRLCVELTEQALMATSSSAGDSIVEMRLRGLRVGLDDFGTGYSSLSYLERLQVDFLKLDTSLVARIATSSPSQVLTRGIIALAKDLGLGVVAEGIEDAAQAAMLSDWGCDVGQGYLFGRPAPLTA